MNSVYHIYLDEELVCVSDWLPRAQAAWDRVTRNREAAQHGGQAVLLRDGVQLASVQPRTAEGHPWPDRSAPVVSNRDVAAAVLELLRHAGVKAVDLADAMTSDGLPTRPARLKVITTLEQGKASQVSNAELVTMCYAGITALKKQRTA